MDIQPCIQRVCLYGRQLRVSCRETSRSDLSRDHEPAHAHGTTLLYMQHVVHLMRMLGCCAARLGTYNEAGLQQQQLQ